MVLTEPAFVKVIKRNRISNYDGIAHQLPWANNATAIEDGDIAKANETLEKAGWVDSDGDGIREKNGTKASFRLYYSSDAPEKTSNCSFCF